MAGEAMSSTNGGDKTVDVTATTTDTTNDFKVDLRHESTRQSSTIRRASQKKTTSVKSSATERRVVKATPPPPSSSSDPSPEESGEGTSSPNDDGGEGERESYRGLVPSKARSVEDEASRENTEKWRQQRLNAAAAFSKEKKDKGLEQRRKASAEGGSAADAGEAAAAEDGTATPVRKAPLPAILSVEPKFPEHKREAGSISPDEAPSEKRVKTAAGADEDNAVEKDDNAGEDAVEDKGSWTDGISKWAKMAVPVVALAAIVAIANLRITRKK